MAVLPVGPEYSSQEIPADELLLVGDRRARFRDIDNRIREEVRKHPDDLGTLSDVATTGGGGEDLGENVTGDDDQADAA